MKCLKSLVRRGIIRLEISLFSVLFLASSLAWPARPQEQEQDLTRPLQYKVSVGLKLITVYVTDKKGNPVEDLTLEDFMATDNGQPVKLTAFEKHLLKAPLEKATAGGDQTAEKAQAVAVQPAPATPRKFFLFFDFAFNHAKGITEARKAALHFLDSEVRADDEVSVLTYSMLKGITFHEYLTKDHDKVRQVVDSIGSKDTAGRAHEIELKYWLMAQEPAGTDIQNSAGQNRETERQEAKRLAESYILRLTALAKALRHEPGQKHFILFSTGIPSSLIYGGQSGNPNSLGGRASFDAGDRVLRTENEEMYKEFAAANCDIFAFDTREAALGTDLFAYDRMTFEDREAGRGMFSAGGIFQDATNIFQDEKTTGGNSLKRIADLTGGKYFSNIKMYGKNLGQVQSLTGSYYVLGYSIEESQDGSFHQVKVEVKRPGCQVRTQSGYFNPKPFRELTHLEKELHLFELALNERSFSRLPVNFPLSCISFPAAEGSGLKIMASIPGEVTSRFEGEKVEYVTIVFDAKNDIRDLHRLESDPRQYQGRTVIFSSVVPLEPGEYTCRLVIRDLTSGSSAVSSIRASVPRPVKPGLKLGTPLLLKEGGGYAYLDGGGGGQPWPEMYRFDQKVYGPVVEAISRQAKYLRVLVPFSAGEGSEPDVALSVQLVEAATGQSVPVTASLAGTARYSRGETAILEVILPQLKPGDYYLYVNGVDRASQTQAYNQTVFSVHGD